MQHAKIIATKALQSLKDIQKRYKEKENDCHSVLESMDEHNEKVDVLTSKNKTLQRKISMLEQDLRDQNLECKRLKDQLRQIDGRQLCDNESSRVNGNVSVFSGTQETYCFSCTYSNVASSGLMGGMGMRIDTSEMDCHGCMGMETDLFFPLTRSARSPAEDFGDNNMFEKEIEYPAFCKEPSVDSNNAGLSPILTNHASNRWAQDFERESQSGFESISSRRSQSSI